jgi:two-component system, NarL family, sensor histidine kinase DesK
MSLARMDDRSWSLLAALLFSGVLVPPLVSAVGAAEPPGRRALAAVAAGLYVVGGAVAVAAVDRAGAPARLAAAYGVPALGVALVALLGAATSWLLVSGLVVTAALRPRWETAVATSAAAVALLLAGSPVDTVVLVVTVVAAASFAVALAEANAALRTAREEIDELVTARERSRIFRDLHDVLGHSLTTIAVKAGLARQLLAAGAAERGAAEVGEVELLARQAVADVRSTVAGTRETTLPGELASARAALRAAGIDGDLPTAVDGVRSDLRQPFAHVLREGVTNVVRHSAARQVTVRIEPELISVRDDGPGADDAAGGSEGAGLRGLRERLTAVGATLEHGPVAGGGYVLVARAAP